MMDKIEISQRSYKVLKGILKKNNINIPTYDHLRKYCLNIDVGRIQHAHNDASVDCECFGYSCNVKETLRRVLSTLSLYEKFEFFSIEQQQVIRDFLILKNNTLYEKFDINSKTLILHDTGDNFCAASRYPTEQTSFSIVNLTPMINSLYGQFITTLWRGIESHENIKLHVQKVYTDLTNLVKNGLTVCINSNKTEHFNVILFLVADLCFINEVIGKCSSNQTYGCNHCKLPIYDWAAVNKKIVPIQLVVDIQERGEHVRVELGPRPNKDSAQYKKFTADNYGHGTT
nr:uncharacterized protein LOC124810022 isoform X2 [Hydra vulgaris]